LFKDKQHSNAVTKLTSSMNNIKLHSEGISIKRWKLLSWSRNSLFLCCPLITFGFKLHTVMFYQ